MLVAPPGAGKTTRTPLALLDEPWATGKRLLLLEPRRLAARAAAARMAATLGEAVGQTIGLAYLPGETAEPGTPLEVEILGQRRRASVVPVPLYDPEGGRMRL